MNRFGRSHVLSFVAVCGFAVFAMGTSKAKEDGADGGSSGTGSTASEIKLKGSCDMNAKAGLCIEYDDALASIVCGMLGDKDSWKKDQPCPKTDVIAKCLMVDKKGGKEIHYYNKSHSTLDEAKKDCSADDGIKDKETKYTFTALVTETAPAASGSAGTTPAASASAGGGGGGGGGGGAATGGGGGGGGTAPKATATTAPKASGAASAAPKASGAASAAPKATGSAAPKK